jgi:hypothetical protein
VTPVGERGGPVALSRTGTDFFSRGGAMSMVCELPRLFADKSRNAAPLLRARPGSTLYAPWVEQIDPALRAAMREQLAHRDLMASGARHVGWKLGVGDRESIGGLIAVGYLTSAPVWSRAGRTKSTGSTPTFVPMSSSRLNLAVTLHLTHRSTPCSAELVVGNPAE